MFETNNLLVQQGWQCPCCKRIYSPTTHMCYYCVPEKQTAQTTSGTGLLTNPVNPLNTSMPPSMEENNE